MASLYWLPPAITKQAVPPISFQNSRQVSTQPHPIYPCFHLKSPSLLCTKLFAWEPSLPYAPAENDNSLVKGMNIFESIKSQDTSDPSLPAEDDDSINMKDNLSQLQQLKWPMWILGPLVLLVTGVVPTLWLPLSSAFLGPNIAGLLSLVGLDCIFNMGATLFLLMADACARCPNKAEGHNNSQAPLKYMLWNISACIVGFVVPMVMLLASNKGALQPPLPFISFSVLLGPYLLLLAVQMLTEMLTWHWGSPVWLVTPVVYEAYRVLQLMRGLRLGAEVGAPIWAVEAIRGLVSWWVLMLGVQLMRVSWFAGRASSVAHIQS
ncbi:hypothetical protein QJS04_geneDACA021649 [Acorus gramineus]|uniref:Transmembrane protein n=1 Tax=Acorus gramineus TaxID=55184 RepID=A0AAV9AD51_ACOGR|nr:hypothetical protein QJS04_geneDACA021649 [Acorus gramineus]